MEEKNEYGNCWEDLVRRLDAEDRVANEVIRRWMEEDEWEVQEQDKTEGSVWAGGGDENRWDGEEGKQRKGSRKRPVKAKEMTNDEKRKVLVEKREERAVKQAKTLLDENSFWPTAFAGKVYVPYLQIDHPFAESCCAFHVIPQKLRTILNGKRHSSSTSPVSSGEQPAQTLEEPSDRRLPVAVRRTKERL
jgi:hypothetical protein